jgi:uncharacterized membrane protein YozB (DUF420 family)
MKGFLGTNAPFWSDVTLVTMFTLFAVAGYGAINAMKKRFTRHCPVMTTAALLNWLPILFYMIPHWFLAAQGNLPGVSGPAQSLPILHGGLGLFTQLLIMYTVTHQNWIKTLPPKKPIWLMRATITFWGLSVLGGLFIYLSLYTPLIFPNSVQ